MDERLPPGFSGRMAKNEFRSLMLEALDRTGMSVAELSRRSGVSYDAINKLKRRENASTSAENGRAIADALGIEWIEESAAVTPYGDPEDGPALVPIYSVQASAGDGSVDDAEDIVGAMALPPRYLGRLTRARIADLSIIGVKGDSMVPSLHDDDIVMLDRTKRDLSFDGLFVIRDDGAGLLVKRIGRASRRGFIMLISDNRDLYPPIERPMQDIEVIGKVIWVGRKV